MSECLLIGALRTITRDQVRGLMRAGLSGVYALADPEQPDNVRYVGSSTNLAKRLADHCTGYLPSNADGPKRAWLAALKKSGRPPVMHVLELVNAPKASAQMHAVERKWIERFRAGGEADLNATLLAGERKFLRDQIRKLEIENAKLRALLMQRATPGATLHSVERCAATQPATQRNGGIEPVAYVAP